MCGHATGEAEEYVLAAISAGLEEIGFAEHIPQYWLPEGERDPEIAMPESRFEEYVRRVLDLCDRYPEITVRLGVEADYVPGREEEMLRLLEPYPWDYVYGSVHYIGSWGFDNPAFVSRYDEWDLGELYGTYFDLICGAAETGLYDVIGHLDVIKKFGHRPDEPLEELYASVADRMGRSGVAVEASTAGYRKPVGELYPAPRLLHALVDRGVPLALGSDAHAPHEVASGFDRATSELRDAGCQHLVRFEQRRRTEVPLAPVAAL